MPRSDRYDVVVVGGGPAGATAAETLARCGRSVLLLDRAGRIKPCGGAVPPRLIRDFAIPDEQIVARITAARMVSPTDARVTIPIEGGYVGMVDREHFDEFLRVRAAEAGAERTSGTFEALERGPDGATVVTWRPKEAGRTGELASARAGIVIGADGANSQVARQALPDQRTKHVFAYHEIVRSPEPGTADFAAQSCDVVYRGTLSPDFYAWIFPHGPTTSVGTGSAHKGFGLKEAVAELRRDMGLTDCETIRREGAPIPLKPFKRWDNGRDVLVAGDAAGIVAPASGEGIYYAMLGGQLAAEAAQEALATGDARALATARKRFMKAHGRVFLILGIMQWFWYASDKRRESFVSICKDKDVQKLTFDAYMNKELVRKKPMAHVRIFFKDLAHLTGLASP